MKYAQLIMGPAGAGKSTFCNTIRQHCENIKRSVHCINLDPAAEEFKYPVSIDIRELISVEEVMDELNYGPNGGLVYAIEFLLQNMGWLEDELGDYEDDYLLIDCPGQIELYSHLDLMKRLVDAIQNLGYRVCGVYLLDSQFVIEPSKFVSGSLSSLSSMVRLELPHINVMTKMDLIAKQMRQELEFREFEDEELVEAANERLDEFLYPDMSSIIANLNAETHPRFARLNAAIGSMMEDYSMINFVPLDPTSEDSINQLMQQIDNAIQYGEDEDVRTGNQGEEEDEDEDFS